MSAQATTPGRVNRRGIGDFVKGRAPIVGLTAYTAPIAGLLDPQQGTDLYSTRVATSARGASVEPVCSRCRSERGRATARAISICAAP